VEYLYHGSAVGGITALEARSKLHGAERRVVYLTDNIPYALFYVWDEGRTGYAGKHVTGWVKNGVAYYEEQFPHQMEEFYRGVPGWLYRAPKGPEIRAVEGRESLFYSPIDTPVKAEYRSDVYEEFLRFEAAGKLKVLRYLEQTKERQAELIALIAEAIARADFFQEDEAQRAFMKRYFSKAWERALALPLIGGFIE